ncbi:MAG TPA: hypothetical protein VJV76_00635, partial [Gaiellaceae bacterium]|nr:hypothetical protein [Gaiellaceae bacterium]
GDYDDPAVGVCRAATTSSRAAGIRRKPTDALPITTNAHSSTTDDQARRVPQLLSREQRKCSPSQAMTARTRGMHNIQTTHNPFTSTSVCVVATVVPDELDSSPL